MIVPEPTLAGVSTLTTASLIRSTIWLMEGVGVGVDVGLGVGRSVGTRVGAGVGIVVAVGTGVGVGAGVTVGSGVGVGVGFGTIGATARISPSRSWTTASTVA